MARMNLSGGSSVRNSGLTEPERDCLRWLVARDQRIYCDKLLAECGDEDSDVTWYLVEQRDRAYLTEKNYE